MWQVDRKRWRVLMSSCLELAVWAKAEDGLMNGGTASAPPDLSGLNEGGRSHLRGD